MVSWWMTGGNLGDKPMGCGYPLGGDDEGIRIEGGGSLYQYVH